MKQTNTIILAVLLVLIGSAFLLSGRTPTSHGPIWLLLAISAVKFVLVGFFFMEGRHAHPAWRIWLLVLLAVYCGAGLLFL